MDNVWLYGLFFPRCNAYVFAEGGVWSAASGVHSPGLGSRLFYTSSEAWKAFLPPLPFTSSHFALNIPQGPNTSAVTWHDLASPLHKTPHEQHDSYFSVTQPGKASWHVRQGRLGADFGFDYDFMWELYWPRERQRGQLRPRRSGTGSIFYLGNILYIGFISSKW